MALAPGARLGVYEIIALIGQGGMGQVFRARDTRLNRDVALKVLPDALSGDSDRLSRFTREAQTLAALNHPHIAQIHGLEESGGVRALVMELVEGEDMAQRLARGPMPLDEALRVATQVAEALEAAHEQGIVHRDLKPANIRLRRDGSVKVLDFGLAKASGLSAANAADPSIAPTTVPATTHAGMVLGTAAYMSPEQAAGRPVDRRTDIWAFGAVLFEMLTGRRAFPGDNLAETLASVVRADPDWSLLPSLPPLLLVFLRRTLHKDPKQRVGDIRDVRLAFEGAFDVPTQAAAAVVSRQGRLRLSWTAAGLVVVGLAIPAVRHLLEKPAPAPVLQLAVPFSNDSSVSYLALSPDGRRLVANLAEERSDQLSLRALDSPTWQPLANTEQGREPFWSPDSRSIGFFANGALKVISAAGGPARVLCSGIGTGRGGTWSQTGAILFASEQNPLQRVDPAGGVCAAVGENNSKSLLTSPVFLSDGRHFLFTNQTVAEPANVGTYLAALDDPRPRKVLSDPSAVVYAAPVAGHRAHLLFLRNTTLMAQPFDDATFQAVGDPITVLPQASQTSGRGVAASVANGTLVYLQGRSTETQLTWFDRRGERLGTTGPPGQHTSAALSSDAAAILTRHRDSTLSLYDLERGAVARVFPSGTAAGSPLWIPRSRRAIFMGSGPSGAGLYEQDMSSGGVTPLLLMDTGTSFVPSGFSPDLRFLVYTTINPKTRADIWYLPWGASPNLVGARPFLATEAVESQGQVSPNGKWIAYTSDETTQTEVYVRRFPEGPGVWRVSVDQGVDPRWSADGRQLYFKRLIAFGRSTILTATVESDGTGGLRIGAPEKLFDAGSATFVPQANAFAYSIHPDGRRLLLNAFTRDSRPTINVVTNWEQSIADRPAP